MTLNYDKVWQAMNDLEEIQGILSSARTTLQASLDYEDEATSRKLVEATVTQIDHYFTMWDDKFQRAWNKTVRELKYQDLEKMRVPSVPLTPTVENGNVESEENRVIS